MELTKALVPIALLALLSLANAGLQITKSELTGGSGGMPWEDAILEHSPAIVGVRSIAIRQKFYLWIQSIQVTYLLANGSTYTAAKHGWATGGTLRSFTLEDDEVIIRVEGKANYKNLVNQLTFITRKANSTARYGPYGGWGTTAFSVEGYVVGFYGRAGALLDAIGVYYLPPVQKSPVAVYPARKGASPGSAKLSDAHEEGSQVCERASESEETANRQPIFVEGRALQCRVL